MKTIDAFKRSLIAKNNELMVFDWDKAAKLIIENKPFTASAGLKDDWEFTGGFIWTDNKPVLKNDYVYLQSTWAIPELNLDDKQIINCFIMESKAPKNWGRNPYWPKSALEIINKEIKLWKN